LFEKIDGNHKKYNSELKKFCIGYCLRIVDGKLGLTACKVD